MGDQHRNVQTGRRLSLHHLERRSWGALRTRRWFHEGRSGTDSSREGGAVPRPDAPFSNRKLASQLPERFHRTLACFDRYEGKRRQHVRKFLCIELVQLSCPRVETRQDGRIVAPAEYPRERSDLA